MKRRDFLKHTAVSATGTLLFTGALSSILINMEPGVDPFMARRGLIRPPGSLEEQAFLARCIRCQRCMQACESTAIRLLGSGAGKLEGTPYLVPEHTACVLCLSCGDVCPTGAIRKLGDLAQVHDNQWAHMGAARVDTDLCVTHNGSGICGACFTVCPLRGKAITQGLHNRPTVHTEHCVGCGMCEESCIVDRDKAIRVYSERRWVS